MCLLLRKQLRVKEFCKVLFFSTNLHIIDNEMWRISMQSATFTVQSTLGTIEKKVLYEMHLELGSYHIK